MSPRIPHQKVVIVLHSVIINNHLKVKYLLCIFDSYIQPVTQQYESELFKKHLCNQLAAMKNMNGDEESPLQYLQYHYILLYDNCNDLANSAIFLSVIISDNYHCGHINLDNIL